MDVHEHDVWLQLGGSAYCLLATGGGADEVHVGLGVDQQPQRLANGDAVVYGKYADRTANVVRQVRSRAHPAGAEVSTRIVMGLPSNAPTMGVKL